MLPRQKAQHANEGEGGLDIPRERSLARGDERGALAEGAVRRVPGRDQYVEVLFAGEAPHVQHDRSVVPTGEPAAPAGVAPRGLEQARVDAAPPHDGVVDAAP